MNRHQPPFIPSALGWALLSQAIWLPLVAIDLHDRWQSSVRLQQLEPGSALASRSAAASSTATPPAALPGSAAAPAQASADGSSPSASSGLTSTGLLLGAASRQRDPLLDDPLTASIDELTSRSRTAPARAVPARAATAQPTAPAFSPRRDNLALPRRSEPVRAAARRSTPPPVPVLSARPLSPFDPLLGGFSRSELLGGPLSLQDRDAPLMPALAMAERARWASSGDPLAPLPEDWREPMRRALRALPRPSSKPDAAKPATSRPVAKGSPKAAPKPAQPAAEADPGPRLQTARVVHLPSSKVRRPTAVPLALQSDGSVDILSRPDDPAVVDEIRTWSGRQKAPETGSIAPAVVHLEPMPEPATSTAAARATAPTSPSAAPSSLPANPASSLNAPAPASAPAPMAAASAPASEPPRPADASPSPAAVTPAP